jgi:CDP-glucose 4,6-dehydratase
VARVTRVTREVEVMSFWRERNVLVTGCTGFLGSWLSRELVARGANVVGLVRDQLPKRCRSVGVEDQITCVRGAVEDGPLVERVLGEYEIDAVFHLAAQAIVSVANADPTPTFEANIKGTWTVLEACRRFGGRVSRIVVASSDKAYGDHDILPYNEDFALQGRHPYDVSKSCADLIALSYHHTYKLPVCVTRCGNLFGGGDLNFSRIVPGTIRSVLQGERPIIRSDGSPKRDYVHVQDIAEAYLVLAEAMDRPDVRGRAFNFGTGTPVTVLELTKAILRAAGREDLEPQVLNQAAGEIKHQYLDATRSREVLGWRPGEPLAVRLAQTVNWYREFLQAAAPLVRDQNGNGHRVADRRLQSVQA